MKSPMRIDDAERRARLVSRHHLGRTASDVAEAVRGVVALHSSDPLTPHLGVRARVPGYATADLDRAIADERTLWRLHGMRRTLFVVARDDAPVVEAAASRDIAAKERRKFEGWVAPEIGSRSVKRWLARLESRVLEVLADGSERRTQDLCDAVPELATPVTLGSGKWSTRSPLSSRLLFLMAMEGRIVRTRPAGTWRSSQYRWAATAAWFDDGVPRMDPARARAELARRYLATHGPATLVDLRWWAGWTVKQAAAAVREVGARTVALDGGGEGLVLPDDLELQGPAPAQVALLPGLDSTPMGWKEREWFLGPHGPRLFDTNGNVGPTVWVDGRVVGGWGQRPDGEVVHRLLEDVGREAAARVAEEAVSLTAWTAGVSTTPRFRTPLERELSARA